MKFFGKLLQIQLRREKSQIHILNKFYLESLHFLVLPHEFGKSLKTEMISGNVHLQETAPFFEETVDSRSGTQKYKRNLEHLVVTESKEEPKE